MPLSLIVAMTRSGVIGRGGELPWKLSADLKRFKALTMGHHIIMGRKTFDSLPRLLPGRVSLVLKRRSSPYDYEFLENDRPIALYDQVVAARENGKPDPTPNLPLAFVHSLPDALRLAAGDEKVFVIGGAEVYALALPVVERLYVTWVEAEVDGDTRFPPIDWSEWREASCERHSADAKNEYDYTFSTYHRLATEPR